MYARQTTMQGDASRFDALARLFQEKGLPALRQQRGLRGVGFLADRSRSTAQEEAEHVA
jgi:hypothetical protein